MGKKKSKKENIILKADYVHGSLKYTVPEPVLKAQLMETFSHGGKNEESGQELLDSLPKLNHIPACCTLSDN